MYRPDCWLVHGFEVELATFFDARGPTDVTVFVRV